MLHPQELLKDPTAKMEKCKNYEYCEFKSLGKCMRASFGPDLEILCWDEYDEMVEKGEIEPVAEDWYPGKSSFWGLVNSRVAEGDGRKDGVWLLGDGFWVFMRAQ
ncbi:uncharacterized protein PAC_12846 [Phialocephala subalpina]|uniref:Uncharacterized protein n=1 Tax=Phialocephala subalpina TaxID=576137 RepID=A0A1L7XD33_9HELO|nr:uncharacterized protein PAC_12846 [Phialocephala subalpina]